MTKFKAVVFDFDLTLCDSSAGFVACHRFAALKFGLPEPSAQAIKASIGTPLDLVFPRFYTEAHTGVRDEYIRVYQDHADEVMTGLTVMLPGAADTVRRLKDAGLGLAIVSQKLRYRVEEVLRREGLLDCFTVVLGGDDIPAFKPDPRGILMALERLDASGSAFYCGDTTIDAEAAANAGLPFVAVLTGVTEAAFFDPYAPLATLPSVAGLPAFLGLD